MAQGWQKALDGSAGGSAGMKKRFQRAAGLVAAAFLAVIGGDVKVFTVFPRTSSKLEVSTCALMFYLGRCVDEPTRLSFTPSPPVVTTYCSALLCVGIVIVEISATTTIALPRLVVATNHGAVVARRCFVNWHGNTTKTAKTAETHTSEAHSIDSRGINSRIARHAVGWKRRSDFSGRVNLADDSGVGILVVDKAAGLTVAIALTVVATNRRIPICLSVGVMHVDAVVTITPVSSEISTVGKPLPRRFGLVAFVGCECLRRHSEVRVHRDGRHHPGGSRASLCACSWKCVVRIAIMKEFTGTVAAARHPSLAQW